MGLTVNNTNTLLLLNQLDRTSSAQSNSLQRLATGFKINKGADDPAGLIAVQSLSSELVGVNAALSNGQRANSVLNTADGALKEIGGLLSDIESLAAASTSGGGLSPAEIAANQAQIDNAIESINRIVQTTSFNGKKLLDGQQAIRTSVDGTAQTDISDVKFFSRPTTQDTQTLAINVVTAGAVASATMANTSSISAGEFSITGKLGTATINVVSGDTLSTIAGKIVAAASETGVSASVSGTELHLQSRGYGASEFVSATHVSGDADFATVAYTKGTNASVTVNGQGTFSDGLRVSFSSNGTSGEFYLTDTGNATGSAGTITVDGGGATFQLGTTSGTQSTLGIDALFSQNLGNGVAGYLNTIKSGGSNDLSTNANNAVAIAKAAVEQVATQQGRIGGFQKYQVETSINSLNSTKQALEDARSSINDVDFAYETAQLNKQNVLLQSAISLLGLANQQSSQVLSLLR